MFLSFLFLGCNLYQTAANAYVCSIMSLPHWKGSRFLKAWDEGAQISELTSFYEEGKGRVNSALPFFIFTQDFYW